MDGNDILPFNIVKANSLKVYFRLVECHGLFSNLNFIFRHRINFNGVKKLIYVLGNTWVRKCGIIHVMAPFTPIDIIVNINFLSPFLMV